MQVQLHKHLEVQECEHLVTVLRANVNLDSR
jgi:hypothetical protein